MPELVTRRQKAVLWERLEGTVLSADETDDYGRPKVTDVTEELDVRWESVSREVRRPDGTPVAITATALVGRAIRIGSIMAQGTLADWGELGTGLATEFGQLMEVVRYEEVPDIDGNVAYREVGLARWGDRLPATG